MTMLIVTHEVPFARRISDTVVFLDGGRIIERGAPADVLDRPTQQRTRDFLKTFGDPAHPERGRGENSASESRDLLLLLHPHIEHVHALLAVFRHRDEHFPLVVHRELPRAFINPRRRFLGREFILPHIHQRHHQREKVKLKSNQKRIQIRRRLDKRDAALTFQIVGSLRPLDEQPLALFSTRLLRDGLLEQHEPGDLTITDRPVGLVADVIP